MKESGYYPVGAEHDPSAPFNEPLILECSFDVDVEFVMRKTVRVTTNDYAPETCSEDGHTYANTENTDWVNAVDNSGNYMIPELLSMLASYVRQDLERYKGLGRKERELREILDSCQGWEVYDKTFNEHE